MDAKKAKGCLLFLVIGIGISWGIYKCQYAYSYWSDLRDRPWAYNDDENAPLLVDTWEGSFKDPDNISKTIRLEIYEPVSKEEREKKAGRKWKNRKGIRSKDKRGFDGNATVISRLGQENYEIYGSVSKEDFHDFSFHFRPEDEKKRILPNFTLLEGSAGHWEGDVLTITLSFGYNTASGYSHYDSLDPRHDKKVQLTLKRKTK